MKSSASHLLFYVLTTLLVTPTFAQVSLPPTTSQDMREARDKVLNNTTPKETKVSPPKQLSKEDSIRVSRRKELISFARQHLNKPYAWGGVGPNAFDCAGFACFVFAKFGISLARMSEGQKNQCQIIPIAQAQPGDLVFYGYPNGRGSYVYTHTAIVYENLTNQKKVSVIHSMYYGVKITWLDFDPSWRTQFICIGRIPEL